MAGKEAVLREHKGFKYTIAPAEFGVPELRMKEFVHGGLPWAVDISYEKVGSAIRSEDGTVVRQVNVYQVSSGNASKIAVVASQMIDETNWSCHVVALTSDPELALKSFEGERDKLKATSPQMEAASDFSDSIKRAFRELLGLDED
ncbi:MAG: hypothetical protein KGH57_01715 [Candidatus Micrarchaeota archaeon]|nr:hypothetical protein [Candidatus Micrarchaeota archaeon]